ncbi:MAG: TolB family protein [Candidatus Methylomirabilaceae bacterium]
MTSPQGATVRQILWDPPSRWIGALGWFPNALYLFVGLARPNVDATNEWWKIRIVYPDFRRLQSPQRPALDPVLSPSGEWIAFLAAVDGRERAFAVRADGSGAHALSPEGARASGLAWSRSGDKLAYARLIDQTKAEIHAVGASSGAPQTLATVRLERADPGAGISLAWSPDELHLAYGTNTGVSSGAVWLLRFAPR